MNWRDVAELPTANLNPESLIKNEDWVFQSVIQFLSWLLVVQRPLQFIKFCSWFLDKKTDKSQALAPICHQKKRERLILFCIGNAPDQKIDRLVDLPTTDLSMYRLTNWFTGWNSELCQVKMI